jgi:hypothetical protein
MNAPCEDAPCCGCCPVHLDTEPATEADGENLDLERDDLDVEDDGELARDLTLEDRERRDFAQDDLPEPDDLGPWDWMTD